MFEDDHHRKCQNKTAKRTTTSINFIVPKAGVDQIQQHEIFHFLNLIDKRTETATIRPVAQSAF